MTAAQFSGEGNAASTRQLRVALPNGSDSPERADPTGLRILDCSDPSVLIHVSSEHHARHKLKTARLHGGSKFLSSGTRVVTLLESCVSCVVPSCHQMTNPSPQALPISCIGLKAQREWSCNPLTIW